MTSAANTRPGRAFAERAAGMLVVPLSRPARDYLVFFRREFARSMNWAGDPSKPASRPVRRPPHAAQELRALEGNGERPVVELATGRMPHRRGVAGKSARGDPAAVRSHEAERRRAQDRQELLIAELNHRVRNILSLIRAVITQSRDAASDLESFTKVVGGRIQALATAHDQITADNWGAGFVSPPHQGRGRRLSRQQGGSRRHQPVRISCSSRKPSRQWRWWSTR